MVCTRLMNEKTPAETVRKEINSTILIIIIIIIIIMIIIITSIRTKQLKVNMAS